MTPEALGYKQLTSGTLLAIEGKQPWEQGLFFGI